MVDRFSFGLARGGLGGLGGVAAFGSALGLGRLRVRGCSCFGIGCSSRIDLLAIDLDQTDVDQR